MGTRSTPSYLSQIAQVETPATPAPVPAAATVAPVVTATASDLSGAKKDWCVKQMTETFFAPAGTEVAPLTQFNNFVNTVCPALELRIPSKYRLFSAKMLNYILTSCCLIQTESLLPPASTRATSPSGSSAQSLTLSSRRVVKPTVTTSQLPLMASALTTNRCFPSEPTL